MSTPYIGEIRLLPYHNRTPQGWLICDGSLLAISEYEVLFTLIGTTYGGNGTSNFGIPDLRGRVPIHQGTGPGLSAYTLGQMGGAETVTLTNAQMPAHNHMLSGSSTSANSAQPQNCVFGQGFPNDPFYTTNLNDATKQPLSTRSIHESGSNLPHDNCAPTLVLQYCIATIGIFPSQN